MSIALSEDEIWTALARAHTGIVTTIRRDGRPVSLPVWFVALDRTLYFRTPAASKKVVRLRRDGRAAFLAECGERWVELTAILLQVNATEVLNEAILVRVAAAHAEKYEPFARPTARLPEVTNQHYESGSVVFALEVVEPPVSWDNSRIRLKAEGAQVTP